MPNYRILDVGSYVTIAITLILFVVALFAKGLTKDLLLEAGVFLVSAKLVLMAHKSALVTDELRSELRQIRALLEDRTDGAV
jgi:hypothetical protein